MLQKKDIVYHELRYIINEVDKTCTVSSFGNGKTEVFCPRSIFYNNHEYVVTSISKNACMSSHDLKSIIFAADSEIRSFEEDSFFISKIESLTIPPNVAQLEGNWCNGLYCSSGIKVSPKNRNFISIDDKAILGKSSPEKEHFDTLFYCIRNIKEISIPSSVEIIESHSFENCENIEKVDFQSDSKLRTIKKRAFFESSISSIMIPSTVTKLEEGWCDNMRSLTEVKLMPNNKFYSTIEDGKIIVGKSTSEKKEFDSIVFCVRDMKGSITIPNSIEIIEPCAFQNCINIDEIIFQSDSKLRIIGSESFSSTPITKINLPSSLEKICSGAFSNCGSLTKIEFTENSKLQIIEKDAFKYSGIENLSIPSSCNQLEKGWCNITRFNTIKVMPNNKNYVSIDDKYILGKSSPEKGEFDSLLFVVRNIENFTIPSSIEIIGPYCFNCSNDLNKIEFSNDSKLRIIDEHAFSFSNIASITFPSQLTKISDRSFMNCQNLEVVEFAPNSNLQIIGDLAFYYCRINTISIPSSVTIIGKQAFQTCMELSKLNIPSDSKLKIIDEYAFANTYIDSIKIPSELTQIKRSAFSECMALAQIEILENSKLQIIEKHAFYYASIISILIPSTVTKLEEEWCDNMRSLTEVKLMPNNKFYSTIEDGKIIVGKSTSEKKEFDSIVFCVRDMKGSITIPNSIEIIEPCAFQNCINIDEIIFQSDSKLRIIGFKSFENSSISKISIPSSLKEIHFNAFNSCQNLTQADIPNDSKLEYIESNVFYLTSIERFSLPSQIKIINEGTFSQCNKLHNFNIPNDSKLKVIERCAFSHSGIENFFIPSELTILKENWGEHTSNLKKVTVDKNNKLFTTVFNDQMILKKSSIENEIYDVLIFCINAEKIIIPNYVEIIEPNVFCDFKDCDIQFQENSKLKIIGKQAFMKTDITSIELPSSLLVIDKSAFAESEIQRVNIQSNSKLQKIEYSAFSSSKIQCFSIPSHVQYIGKFAFECDDIQILEFQDNDDLQSLDEEMFEYINDACIVMVSVKLTRFFSEMQAHEYEDEDEDENEYEY